MKDKHYRKSLRELEEHVALQTSRKRIETAVLGTVALAGIATLALMAPNALSLLRHALPDGRAASQKQSVTRAVHRLIRNGCIAKVHERYTLTEKGKQRLTYLTSMARLVSTTRSDASRRRWDGKWRIVIFDVHEKQHLTRDSLRRTLNEAGFTKLQASVWVYPYRCEEVVALLKLKLRLGYSLVYIVADAIEGDERLRSHYNLPHS